jgi:hypothetical protein
MWSLDTPKDRSYIGPIGAMEQASLIVLQPKKVGGSIGPTKRSVPMNPGMDTVPHMVLGPTKGQVLGRTHWSYGASEVASTHDQAKSRRLYRPNGATQDLEVWCRDGP